MDPNDYFVKGAEVEISSDEEGFRGSWFLGTIVRSPTFHNRTITADNKVLVQYKTIFVDEVSGNLLQEYLNLVQLRPPAPRELDRKFHLSEEVDACHNDGWWEGVITEVLDGDRYSVFFRATREQIEFEKSNLRLHREWKNGKWYPPLEDKPKEVVKEEKFIKGMLVEVSSDEEGFEGAWFVATVAELLEDGKFIIEYKSLRNEDDTEFLREEVTKESHIRPCPPDVAVERFNLNQEVDALHNDGWWVGIISKVLDDGTYIVYFLETGENIAFKHLDLRIHQEWINGKWTISSQIGGLKEA
ncbi:protein AGENET DOMAIN (AGD)-CONTAINING P1 [Impatiens glandulifera]|uniref:protein AGENET DOMAIN (AGD)-CONTAINING P1 n=1 Tax=Impatiens glandulifera TaxID=253017 RepID=UPI001FB07A4F|nr:protein AGENET DOMAIN (AGD)-CONTAINING P1 [Impatiens glandulifera]